MEAMHDGGILQMIYLQCFSLPQPSALSMADYAFAFFATEPFGDVPDPVPDSDFRLFSISSL
jgi:hypothetical protein